MLLHRRLTGPTPPVLPRAEGRHQMKNDSIDRLTSEWIHELGKMSIAELEYTRPVLVEELDKQGVGKKAEIYCLAMIDLVIEKKKRR